MEKRYKIYRMKIAFIGLVFVFFFCAVTLRSYQLQIQGNSKLNHLAKSQYRTKLTESPKRGAIYDRNGEVLALDVLVASVGIHPHLLTDKKRVQRLLEKNTDLTAAQIKDKLHSRRRFEWVQRRIPKERGQVIAQQKIKGIQVIKEYRRFYPNKDMAGQVLGAVGYDAKALGGVELSFDDYLKSGFKKQSVQRDARGRLFSPLAHSEVSHDLYLTIDKNIQYITEKALKDYAVKHDVKSGFAVVTDVETGEVLAMANFPSFNPNLYWKFPQSFWKNHAITDIYEPGSTFKTILMAAAMSAGEVTPKSRFYCENGKYRINNYVISDHGAGYGWMEASDILKVSSNIGVTKIAKKIGRKTFYDFIKNAGFVETTGMQLKGELLGYLKPYKTWKDIEFSNIAFGQGLSINGLQMIQAYGAIANGGELVRPSIVKKIKGSDGKVRFENKPDVVRRIMPTQIAKDLTKMLHRVTRPGGTATQAHVDGYYAGGKTGTAQKFDSKLKAYAENDYISSFVGFTPIKNPKLAIYVVYDTPRKNGYYGGVVAGPVFKEVAERSLKYLSIVPDFKDEDKIKLAELKKNKTEKNKLQSEKASQLSSKELVLLRKKRLENIKKDLNQKIVPDFRGLTIRKVMEVMKSHSMSLSVKGSGVVIQQSPKPGSGWNAKKGWVFELGQRS